MMVSGLFRLNEKELDAVLTAWGFSPAGEEYDVMVSQATVKKVAGKIESMVDDGMWLCDILKVMKEEAEL